MLNILIRWRRNVILIICQTVRLDFTLLKYEHRTKFERWGGILNTLKTKIAYRDQEECVLNTQLRIYKVSYDYAGVKH